MGKLWEGIFCMKEVRFALKQSFPIFFTYVFLGIAFGVMMGEIGYGPLASTLSAVFIYAGSMQIVMVSLLKAGAPLYTVALMTLFVNGRHLFYGVGLIDRYRKAGWRYPYLVFALTDETYSIVCSAQYPDDIDRSRADFLISLFNQSYWVLGCFLGGVAGRLMPTEYLTGIDFSATAFFVVVVVNQLRSCPSKIPVLTGFISGLGFLLVLGPDRFLIPALSVAVICLILLRNPVQRKLEVLHE